MVTAQRRKISFEEYLNYDDDKGSYSKTVFTESEAIASPTFPQLKVTVGEILET